MYRQSTRSVRVSVEPFYDNAQSSPSQGRFIFGYRVTIDNQREEAVQLLSRYWRITDSQGRSLDVQGEGVVGEQPIIEPGEKFEYTSGTPLSTPNGIMVGHYKMVAASGERFDVAIPAFSLDTPGIDVSLN